MSCCACCCFYPKYKRKVDNIYPRSLDAPLIKIEVEKLQYYVKQHPEKLSKVGEFLYQHLKWGLTGSYKNRNYVKNTVEAVDKILLVITPQNLNYYAANYLKIIQKLLEQGGASTGSIGDGINNANNDYLEYQKLAANLFRKFCDKEASNQSTANYNLNYDSFVFQFSSMCYNNNKDDNARAEIRSSGLQCLATMVKRLVPEDNLNAGFLWDNMDKIVPALLFIMHESYLQGTDSKQFEQDENINEDDVEFDHDLDRYLYGDFFIHSRTKDCLTAEQNSIHNSGDIDGIRVEYRKQSTAFSNITSEKTIENGNGGNMTASNSDEVGTVFLLNRKNSLEIMDPDHEAKMLLKNLACKADYTTISKIVLPILNYLDANKPSGWEYSRFIRCIFLILMYNVKQQHAIVIKELIKHLDSHINSSAKLKCQIIRAISTCIRIAAMHSVGTTGQIIEIFTYLLKHLKSSVEKLSTIRTQLITKKTPMISSPSSGSFKATSRTTDETSKLNKSLTEEQNLQRKIIDAMGQFTANLPDYSKNDVVMFIARQINSQQFNYVDLTTNNQPIQVSQQNIKDQQNTQLRAKYFECLHEICTKYRPTQLFSAFTSVPFLEDILRLTLVADWASRRKAHEILHLLLDKYQFLNKIKTFKPNLFNEVLTSTSGIITNKKDGALNKSTGSIYKPDKLTASTVSLQKTLKENASFSASMTSINKITRNQTYLSQLELNDSRLSSSREDIQFMRKHGRILLAHLNESLFLSNNRRENYESIYLTTCLFLIGLYNENEFLVDLVRFGFHVQELALLNYEQTTHFSFTSHCNVHKFVCAFFLLVSKSSGIPALYDYCSEICDVRRKKNLYHYVYPEYILMNTAGLGDSGIQSPRTSLSEIESEFKRELKASSQEYSNMVRKYEEERKKLNESKKEDEDNVESELADKKSSKNDLSSSAWNLSDKMAPWLFSKKIMAEIIENAGYPTIILEKPNSEYSLSVGYLQQTVTSLQTALKFRSPYSVSIDSFSNIPNDSSVNFHPNSSSQIGHSTSGNIASSMTYNNIADYHHYHKHNRGFSTSGQGLIMGTGLGPSSSTHQLGSTSRRSIDVESNLDGDDTSYDSASQYSMDQSTDPKLFYIDPSESNQMTVSSGSHLKQYQDLNSFETIRRVLLNGNNNNVASAGNSLVNGHAASIASSMNNRSGFNFQNNNHRARSEVTNGEEDLNSNQSDQNEMSMRIISDFKQKTFDEQKQTLLRTNQTYLNNEKYQQVFEFISKELTTTTDKNGQIILPNNLSNASQVNGGTTTTQPTKMNIGILNSGSTSNISTLADNANSSISVNSLNSNPSVAAHNQTSSQMIPLNDIEFPKLFMY